MSAKVKLGDLTPQQRAVLKNELKKELQEKESQVKELRKGYKDQVNKTIPELFQKLKKSSELLATVKEQVYNNLQALVQMKSDVYDREQDQGSHSFTTDDGTTIIIGNRSIDGWDDTVDVGIQKVTDYIQSLGKDANSKRLVKTVLQLLSKDKTGNLKASRVLQLKKLAEDIADAAFIDAIQIIQDAYRPNKTKQFVTCRYKDEVGKVIELPLSITDVDFKDKKKATA
jgi:hypothetical protein